MYAYPPEALVTDYSARWGWMAISNSSHHGGVVEEPLALIVNRGNGARSWYTVNPGRLAVEQVIANARALRRKTYDALAYNCEHFIRHAAGLVPKSPQVRTAVSLGIVVTLLIKAKMSHDREQIA